MSEPASALFNTQTREPEELPFDQIPQAILAGTHSYKNDAPINVVDDSGTSYSLPASQLKDALHQGYQLENPKQSAIREAVNENDNIMGSAKVALRSFGDELGLGVPEILRRHGQDDFERAKEDAINQSHSIANATGSVLGFGASIAATEGLGLLSKVGKVGEAASDIVARQLEALGVKRGSESAAKDVLARVATKGAQLGTEGALVSTPRAVTEAALGDPKAAAESLLVGGLVGGLFGVGLGAMSKPWDMLAEKMAAKSAVDEEVSKNWFDMFRTERASKALGYTQAERNKLGEEKTSEIADYILNSRTAEGEKIIGPLDSRKTILDKLEKFNHDGNNTLDQVYSRLDNESPYKVDVQPLIEKIDHDIKTKYNLELTSEERGIMQKIRTDLETLSTHTNEAGEAVGRVPQIDFGDARGFIKKIGEVAFPKGRKILDPTPRQIVARDAYFSLRDQVDSAAERAADHIGDPKLLEQFQKARKDVAMSIPAMRVLGKQLSREAGNKLFGLTDTIAGVGLGSGIGTLPALGAVAAKKLAEKYGNQVLANLDFEAPAFIEKTMKRIGLRMDQIPDAIDGMRTIGHEKNIKAAALNQILNLRKDEAPKKVKEMQERTHHYVANPQKLMDDASAHLAPIEKLGAPNVAAAAGMKVPEVIDYVHSIIPKPLTPPNPFQSYEFKPSDQQMAKFKRQLGVLMDPMSVVDDLKNGTLTKDQMETLQAVYPVIFQHIQMRALNHLMTKKPKLTYQSRLKLSMLLGFNMDSSVEPGYATSLQDNFRFATETIEQGGKLTFAESAQPDTEDNDELG